MQEGESKYEIGTRHLCSPPNPMKSMEIQKRGIERNRHIHTYTNTQKHTNTHTHTHTSTYCPSSSLHDQRKVKQEYRMVVFTDPSRHISSSNLKTLMKEFDLRALFLLNYSLRYAVLLQNHVRVVGRISPYGSSRGF